MHTRTPLQPGPRPRSSAARAVVCADAIDAAPRSAEACGATDVAPCDEGWLTVGASFRHWLESLGLDSFEKLWNLDAGAVVRRVGSRETSRVTLPTSTGPRDFYLKRFGAPRWRDWLRTLLHMGWPIHGARPEWEAIHLFIAARIPTLTPVAFGESGDRSLLLTAGLSAHCNLLEFAGGRESGRLVPRSDLFARHARTVTHEVADLTRRMHAAGLHHQDFYLNHLLLCGDERSPEVRVIDLGRARQRRPLARRWIIKDLAQLNFSAQAIPWPSRLRFLRWYLGRPFSPADRRLARRIAFKSQRIASHTEKHRL
ncbi:MAG: lipopolysaccharide kinase InaA family protein [Planctomycetaceae bacterium]